MFEEIPTPCILIDATIVRRNLERMAAYAQGHGLNLRPHTKTHKSLLIGRMQIEMGAVGLTVAKPGEAQVMAGAANDLLMAYPAVDPRRCAELAELARRVTLRVAIDSTTAVDALAQAARGAGVVIGILIDLDVGLHRTGVQTPAEALVLAQYVAGHKGLRLDGIMFYPGHAPADPGKQSPALHAVEEKLAETIDLWGKVGLEAKIVSGGSTPSAGQSHLVKHATEIRPGTYVFNDMNGVYGGSARLEDCAAPHHLHRHQHGRAGADCAGCGNQNTHQRPLLARAGFGAWIHCGIPDGEDRQVDGGARTGGCWWLRRRADGGAARYHHSQSHLPLRELAGQRVVARAGAGAPIDSSGCAGGCFRFCPT